MSEAFRAWRIATRALWWAFVLWTTRAATLHAKAVQADLVLHPRTPRDLWNAGYVIFAYRIQIDAFEGVYREPDDDEPGMRAQWDTRRMLWKDIPWHQVSYSHPDYKGLLHRAVPKVFADAHLRIVRPRMAA